MKEKKMFGKKIFLTLGTIALVVASAAMFAAFEAHVINVTAHIENALYVDPNDDIEFGTVFPQEYLEEEVTVGLSESFLGQSRINDVEYKIVQKPKPCPLDNNNGPIDDTCVVDGSDGITPHNPTGWHYKDLCRFLSKLPDGSPDNDNGVPSYYQGNNCTTPSPEYATGKLNMAYTPNGGAAVSADHEDTWTIDLKVPPVDGYVGQDWPETCMSYVVPEDSTTYGCDLWIEVTGFTKDGVPVVYP
jgi:hypothetical protein